MKSSLRADAPQHVGGQAIFEGVMMRSPERISAVVRLPGGKTERKIWESRLWCHRHKLLNWPVVRGVVSLIEALVIGISTLNWSAEIALAQEQAGKAQKKRKPEFLGLLASFSVAILLAIVLFMLVPYELASLLHTDKNQALFHLVAGSTRILFFLAYIWLISYLKDIRRIFEYHGAEHQAIFTYEKGEELLPENARRQSCFHPRCGTSFLLIVAILTMAMFVLFDITVVAFWGNYSSAIIRLLVHLPFLPLVAGLAYEVLRFADRYSQTGFMRVLIFPGLALQKMTTRPPDDLQREVALEALKAALPEYPPQPQYSDPAEMPTAGL